MFLNLDELEVQSFLTEDDGEDRAAHTSPPFSADCPSPHPCQVDG